MRIIKIAIVFCVVACAGDAEDVALEQDDTTETAGETGCGLDKSAALEEWPNARLCETTVYRPATGYCSRWEPCPQL